MRALRSDCRAESIPTREGDGDIHDGVFTLDEGVDHFTRSIIPQKVDQGVKILNLVFAESQNAILRPQTGIRSRLALLNFGDHTAFFAPQRTAVGDAQFGRAADLDFETWDGPHRRTMASSLTGEPWMR